MALVDLDGFDNLTPVDDQGLGSRILQHLRALPAVDRIALIGVLAVAGLAAGSATLAWGTTIHGEPTGPSTQFGIATASNGVQWAYDGIWLALVVTGAGAVLDPVRRRVWYGVAAGVLGTAALMVLPIRRNLDVLTTASRRYRPALVPHLHADAGSYCAIAALGLAAAVLTLIVRGRILPSGARVATAVLLGAYMLTAIGQLIPWLTTSDRTMTAALSGVGRSAKLGPCAVLADGESAYYLLWMVIFAGAGALLFARRWRRPLFATVAAAVATQALLLASLLHEPTQMIGAGLFPLVVPWHHTAGSYVILTALVLAALALIVSVGGRVRPIGTGRRIGAGLLILGLALALWAQLTTWAEIHTYQGPARFGVGEWPTGTQVAFYLAWFTAFAATGAMLFAGARLRPILLGASAGAICTLLAVVTPVMYRLSTSEPAEFAPHDHPIRGPGGFLALAAITVLAAAALIGSVSTRSQTRPLDQRRRATAALAVAGAFLALCAQTLHWQHAVNSLGLIGPVPDIGAYGWGSAVRGLLYLPMLVCWLLAFTTIGAAWFADGRTRVILGGVAAVALAGEAALTVELLVRPELMIDLPAHHLTVVHGPGAYAVIAALVALALSVTGMLPVRLPSPAPETEPGDGSPPAEPVVTVPQQHRMYMRPEPDRQDRA